MAVESEPAPDRAVEPAITRTVVSADGSVQRERWDVATDPRDGIAADDWIWLDVVAADEAVASDLARHFALDRATREDIVEVQQPKFEELDAHRVFVLQALANAPDAIRTVEVDVVVGDRWVLSIHDEVLRSVDELARRLPRPSFIVESPFHLAARLFEFIGERYLPLLDEVDSQIIDLEDAAIVGDSAVLGDIHALRRDIAVLRRALGPQRRMLDIVARLRLEDGRAARDLADALDHHDRLVDSLESAHGLVGSLLDTYRSATAEQMNQVMKTLTVFTAIFMPLTLITGLYGMNFEHMPELGTYWGYAVALGAMAVIAGGLWTYFVRRGFIDAPEHLPLRRPARVAGRVGRGLAAAASLPIRAATGRGQDET